MKSHKPVVMIKICMQVDHFIIEDQSTQTANKTKSNLKSFKITQGSTTHVKFAIKINKVFVLVQIKYFKILVNGNSDNNKVGYKL